MLNYKIMKSGKRVGIIGGSSAAAYLALMLDGVDVTIIEKEAAPLRKFNATGNGRCNLTNRKMSGRYYNHPEYLDGLQVQDCPQKIIDFFSRYGIATTDIDGLIYPASLSAPTLGKRLAEIIRSKGTRIVTSTKVVSYRRADNCYEVKTDRGTLYFDALVFAIGGMSQHRLGSDGSLFGCLQTHGYQIEQLRPGLAPIKTKQKLQDLKGCRHKAKVKCTIPGGESFEEEGEVLFKGDGLSGIVIFNLSSFLARRNASEASISLDLFPGLGEAELTKLLNDSYKAAKNGFLKGILEEKLAMHIEKLAKSKSISEICRILKDFRFDFAGYYGFDDSQVSIGGVKLEQLSGNLESKKEPGVYFAGECLDVDGYCGGYNLTWCFLSAQQVAERINSL